MPSLLGLLGWLWRFSPLGILPIQANALADACPLKTTNRMFASQSLDPSALCKFVPRVATGPSADVLRSQLRDAKRQQMLASRKARTAHSAEQYAGTRGPCLVAACGASWALIAGCSESRPHRDFRGSEQCPEVEQLESLVEKLVRTCARAQERQRKIGARRERNASAQARRPPVSGLVGGGGSKGTQDRGRALTVWEVV